MCGIAVTCAAILSAVGKTFGAIGSAVRIGGSILIFGALTLLLGGGINEMRASLLFEAVEAGFSGGAFSLMIKSLGIALVSKFCADVCRDCGESTLANGVESAGRIAMISLCIPLLAEVLEHASEILDTGI